MTRFCLFDVLFLFVPDVRDGHSGTGDDRLHYDVLRNLPASNAACHRKTTKEAEASCFCAKR